VIGQIFSNIVRGMTLATPPLLSHTCLMLPRYLAMSIVVDPEFCACESPSSVS
jgi:hypothetical protein